MIKFRFVLLVVLVYQCLNELGVSSIQRNADKLNVRHKRFMNQPNEKSQECRTPTGSSGHCKRVKYCPLPELKQNNMRFLDYLCIIEQSSVGVCCPDDLNANAHSSTVLFPQRADDAPPIWDADEALTGKVVGGQSNLVRPAERGCGLSTKSFSKIVGGRPADPSEWPWMAAILRRGYPRIFCGGVLITDRHILSAAHCVYRYNKNDITVRLGEYDFDKKNETRARDFHIVEVHQHIDFDETTYDNDICIMKLHQAVLFNSYIWPVCMPPTDDTFEGYVGIVTGWGSQFFGGPSSGTLMEVSLPIWNQNDCQNAFIERIGEQVLCAGADERDSCQGDSGGPLLVQLPNKRWTVVGIVSYGIRCGEKNRPGVYTRVSSYSSWIIENATF